MTAGPAPDTLRVLLIEDNAAQVLLLRETLIRSLGADMESVDTLRGGLARLQDVRFDVVMLDLALPDSVGLETLRAARRAAPEVPMVVLTGLDDESLGIRALQEGAQDYLVKGRLSGREQVRAVRYAIERKRIIDALAAAEANLRSANEELEQRVAERTAQLERVMEDMRSFSFSVSHDLRSPARAIAGLVTLLQESIPTGSDERDMLDRIERSVRRMELVIDGMLVLARVTRTELNVRPVDLVGLARELIAEIRAEEPTREVDLRCPESLVVEGDEDLLRIALDNLLRNAWKFTAGCPVAWIELGAELSPRGRAIVVRDNGVGFDMAVAHRLFQPFQRLHRGGYEGAGIGLATTHRVIRRQGGDIWAESSPGAGAAFYFTLPPPTMDEP